MLQKKAHSVLRWREHEAKQHKAEEAVDEIRKKEEEHLAKYRAERDARRLAGKFRMRYGPREKENIEHDDVPRVSIIIKGDVHGSVEALLDVFDTYTSNERCRLDVVHYGVGNVSEGDIELAKAFNAIVYGFSVPAPTNAPKDVTIRCYDVIYRLIDDLKKEISSKLPAMEVEEIVGEANVLQQFFINDGRKEVPVAGCRCVKGVLKKAHKFRLVRDDEVLYEGAFNFFFIKEIIQNCNFFRSIGVYAPFEKRSGFHKKGRRVWFTLQRCQSGAASRRYHCMLHNAHGRTTNRLGSWILI